MRVTPLPRPHALVELFSTPRFLRREPEPGLHFGGHARGFT